MNLPFTSLFLITTILTAFPASAQSNRTPTILHRIVLSCDGKAQGPEQKIDLSNGYTNYTCNSRFYAQCIQDGSWDNFYMEWCEYSAPKCQPSRLHRNTLSCRGEMLTENEVIDLAATGYSNYTCDMRFKEQCVDDGSFDNYYQEWCEYSCDSGASPRTK